MKKKALIGLAVLAVVALMAVGTWAWFTAETDKIVNTFTAGTVDVKINEDFEADKAGNWNPGQSIKKEVSVTNIGSKCAYVRVLLDVQWFKWGEEENDWVASDLSTDNVSLNLNTTDWMFYNGYYYYKSSIGANESTTNLLNSVTLVGADTGDEYQGAKLEISVKAEAVQCTNDAYKDVWNLTKLPWESDD